MKAWRKFKNLNDSDKVFLTIVYTLVILIGVIVLYPLWFVVIASVSNPMLVASGDVLLLPKGFNIDGYKYVLNDVRILRGYYNTIRYTFFGTLVALFITLPAGYALSRRDVQGRGWIMKFVLLTNYFGGGLIPTYLVVKGLHLVNTPYVLMILGSFSVGNMILCRTFFWTNLPLELQEAAEIDGCNIFQYFVQVVLPLSKAIIAIMALYYSVGHWNSFFNGLIYITDSDLYPLQLIIREILIAGRNLVTEADPDEIQEMLKLSETIKYAVIIVSSLPVLAIYPFAQKYFVKGIMVGSLKG